MLCSRRAHARLRLPSPRRPTTVSPCTFSSTSGRQPFSPWASPPEPDVPLRRCARRGRRRPTVHPAVIEAHHGGIGLLVCTADRPPALRDVGAPQTIDQQHLYGTALRWFSEVATPCDEPGIGAYWRSIASRACSEAMGTPPGPVHLNFCFAEPLIPTGAELVPAPGRGDGRPWTTHAVGRLNADDALLERCALAVRAHPRGFLVSGWGAQVSVATAERFAEAAGWPILADPLSGLRVGVHAIASYEAMLRIPAFAAATRPELVVRVGAPLTSRVANEWLDASVAQILVTADGRANDPQRIVTERIVADPDQFLGDLARRLGAAEDTTWSDALARADVVAQRAIDRLFETWDDPFEGRVARDVVGALPEGTWFAVASSMPVRDVETFAVPRSGVRFVANRGANGIDGFVSTVMGLAQVSRQRVVALVRRPLLPSRCQWSDGRGGAGGGCHVRDCRQRWRWNLLVPAAGRPPRALRKTLRYASWS